jgi:hypothetical protein
MSSRRRSVTGTVPASDWLAPRWKRFLSSLVDQGYTRRTLRTYGDAAAVLCREVLRRRLRPGQLSGRSLVKARAATSESMKRSRQNHL